MDFICSCLQFEPCLGCGVYYLSRRNALGIWGLKGYTMGIIVVTVVFILAFGYIVGFMKKTVKEGDICQCDSNPAGCHKRKGAAGCH